MFSSHADGSRLPGSSRSGPFAVAVVLIGAILGLVAGCGDGPTGDEAYRLVEVERAPFVLTVETAGVLEPLVERNIQAPYSSIIEWLVEEGTFVEEGEPVARFDSSDHTRNLEGEQLDRKLATRDKELKDLELDLEQFELLNRLAFGEGDLGLLRITHDVLAQGVDPAEVARIEMARENGENALANLRVSRNEKQPYAARGFVSREDMATLEVKISREKLQLQVLELEDRIARRGGKPVDIVAAARDIHLSTSAIEYVRVQADSFDARRLENARELETKLGGIESEIEYLESLTKQSVARAPISGVVLYGRIHMGGTQQEKVKVGARAHQGSRVMRISKVDRMKVVLKLSARDAQRVNPDQKIHFRLSAYPDEQLTGTVTRTQQALSGNELDRWIHPVMLTLQATAELDASSDKLKPGMSGQASIQVETRPGVLSLPSGAVVDGAVILADGTRRAVETGAASYDRTEILSGLEESQQVRLPGLASPRPPSPAKAIPVTRGDLVVQLEASGEVEAEGVTNIAIQDLRSDGKIAWLAKEGDVIPAGELVAKLEEKKFKDDVAEKQLALQTLQKEKDVLDAKQRVEGDQLRDELDVARQDLEVARLEKKIIDGGKLPRELADLRYDLQIAERDLKSAQSRLDLKLELAAQGNVAADEIKDLTEKRDDARAAHRLARVKLDLGLAGYTRSEHKKAELKVRKAELTLKLVQKKLDVGKQRRDTELRKLQFRVADAERQLKRFESILASAQVTAPVTGTVVLLEHWSQSGPVKTAIGDTVNEGVPFMRLANQSSFRIKAQIPEERLAGVAKGQAATFWPLQSPGQQFQGTVESIAPIATEKRRMFGLFEGSRVFDVRIDTDLENRRFQPGLSVGCRLLLSTHPQVLKVPVNALHASQEGSYLFLKSGERRSVTVGPMSESEAAIEAGLAEGDVVLVAEGEDAS